MQELIRITESGYNEIKRLCMQVEEKSRGMTALSARQFFADRNNFPSPEALQAAGLQDHFREWLPYLIYYSKVYEPSELVAEQFVRTKEFLDSYLQEWLDVIPDKTVAKINSIALGEWASMSQEARQCRFKDLIEYYSPEEFDTFIRDLGWKNFMASYDIQDKSQYVKNEDLLIDLWAIWDGVQNAPI